MDDSNPQPVTSVPESYHRYPASGIPYLCIPYNHDTSLPDSVIVNPCTGMYWHLRVLTARVSKQRPDKLLTEFKRIDSSLKRWFPAPADSGGIGTRQRNAELPEVQLAIRTHELLQQIDRYTAHELVSLSSGRINRLPTYTGQRKLARLKKSIAGYNQF